MPVKLSCLVIADWDFRNAIDKHSNYLAVIYNTQFIILIECLVLLLRGASRKVKFNNHSMAYLGRPQVDISGQSDVKAFEQGDDLHREVHRRKLPPPELQRCPRYKSEHRRLLLKS